MRDPNCAETGMGTAPHSDLDFDEFRSDAGVSERNCRTLTTP
jgi:hypothetical protein